MDAAHGEAPSPLPSAIPRGVGNDYTRLRGVPLGRPSYRRWAEAGPVTARTLQNRRHTGVSSAPQLAAARHAGRVRIHERAGVHRLCRARGAACRGAA